VERFNGLEALRAHLKGRLIESGVPDHLHDGLTEYIATRRPVGHFLTACLSNDLKEACARADETSKTRLWHVVFFLYNYAPGTCWGSPEKVMEWLQDPASTPLVFD
jgi:hypothetical protein